MHFLADCNQSNKQKLLLVRASNNHPQEQLVQTGVVVELRMESGGQLITLTGGHDMTIDGGQDFYLVAQHALDIGSTDKGHGNIGANAFDGAHGMETAQLAPVGTAAHFDVHRAQAPL